MHVDHPSMHIFPFIPFLFGGGGVLAFALYSTYVDFLSAKNPGARYVNRNQEEGKNKTTVYAARQAVETAAAHLLHSVRIVNGDLKIKEQGWRYVHM